MIDQIGWLVIRNVPSGKCPHATACDRVVLVRFDRHHIGLRAGRRRGLPRNQRRRSSSTNLLNVGTLQDHLRMEGRDTPHGNAN
jgi:hypothetical protein